MKKSIISLLFVFLLSTLFAGNLFATNEPIPGVDIIVKKNPGGIAVANTHTDKEGKFSFTAKEKGNYDITITYADIVKALNKIPANKDVRPDNYAITLVLSDGSKTTRYTITKTSKPIMLTIAKDAGVVVSGVVTYEIISPRDNASGSDMKKSRK